MHKAHEAGQDLYKALPDFCNTPSEGLDASPAQRLFGRQTKTLLLLSTVLLKTPGSQNSAKQLWSRKERQEQYNYCSTIELEALRAGDTVHIKLAMGEIRWTKATVQDQVNIRSYNKPRKISTQESSLPKKNA